MTRTEHIPPNPNHIVGNHPLINSGQLDQYYPEPEGSRPAFPSGFNDASFHMLPVDCCGWENYREAVSYTIRHITEAPDL